MHLVGMLDSPYVRFCAIAATLLDLPFEHSSVSVFRHMDRFRSINPLMKAPTLVADDGTVLTDSAVILQHMEDVAGRSLRPADPAERLRDLKVTGIAIVACDKAVGVEYERKRPQAQRSEGWMSRIQDQLATALGLLDAEAELGPPDRPGGITAAIAWGFCRFTIPECVAADGCPRLAAHAAKAEATAPFRRWPIDLP